MINPKAIPTKYDQISNISSFHKVFSRVHRFLTAMRPSSTASSLTWSRLIQWAMDPRGEILYHEWKRKMKNSSRSTPSGQSDYLVALERRKLIEKSKLFSLIFLEKKNIFENVAETETNPLKVFDSVNLNSIQDNEPIKSLETRQNHSPVSCNVSTESFVFNIHSLCKKMDSHWHQQLEAARQAGQRKAFSSPQPLLTAVMHSETKLVMEIRKSSFRQCQLWQSLLNGTDETISIELLFHVFQDSFPVHRWLVWQYFLARNVLLPGHVWLSQCRDWLQFVQCEEESRNAWNEIFLVSFGQGLVQLKRQEHYKHKALHLSQFLDRWVQWLLLNEKQNITLLPIFLDQWNPVTESFLSSSTLTRLLRYCLEQDKLLFGCVLAKIPKMSQSHQLKRLLQQCLEWAVYLNYSALFQPLINLYRNSISVNDIFVWERALLLGQLLRVLKQEHGEWSNWQRQVALTPRSLFEEERVRFMWLNAVIQWHDRDPEKAFWLVDWMSQFVQNDETFKEFNCILNQLQLPNTILQLCLCYVSHWQSDFTLLLLHYCHQQWSKSLPNRNQLDCVLFLIAFHTNKVIQKKEQISFPLKRAFVALKPWFISQNYHESYPIFDRMAIHFRLPESENCQIDPWIDWMKKYFPFIMKHVK